MPNNNFEPTEQDRRTVESMIGYGMKVEDVCKGIINKRTGEPISRQTCYKYFRNELDTGHIKANAAVAESLFKQAVEKENTTAAIWWTKSRMGWKETTALEHGGELKISWDAVDDALENMIDGE